MEALIQPSALKPQGFLGAVVGLCAVVTIVVGVRLWTNYKHLRKLYADDYLSLFAIPFLVWNAVTFYYLITALNSNPDDITIEYITRLCAIGIFAGNSAMYTAKLPLIFLLIRTFGIEMWLRRTCQALVIIGLLGFLGSAIYTGISCSPALNVVSPLYLFKCITAVTQGTITRGSVSLMMDVVLFFLPLKVIKKLHLPLRRKIGLGLVFMTGLAAIAASSLGVYFQVAQSEGTSSNFANALLITVLESAIVILVSCAPSLHLFWTQQAYSLRMRLGLVSRMSMSTTPKTKSGSSTRATIRHSVRHTPKESVSMSSGPIQVTTHHYVELRDLPGSDAVEKPAAAYGAYEAKASRNWDQV